MSLIENKSLLFAMYRRWAYMLVGIIASSILFTRPVFNFNDDKGIIYVRSFSMDEKTFYVTQTEMTTGASEVTATSSVAGLYYCNKVMLWGCILCLVCFFNNRLRALLALLTAIVAGFYYVITAYYALTISEDHYATLYPNFMIIWPAIVCQMMILTRHNLIKQGLDEADQALEEPAS